MRSLRADETIKGILKFKILNFQIPSLHHLFFCDRDRAATPPRRRLSKSLRAPTTMSRSALWRQEANVQGRERQADEAFLEAVEAGKVSCLIFKGNIIARAP